MAQRDDLLAARHAMRLVGELDALAETLCISAVERTRMLGLSTRQYRQWRSGLCDLAAATPPDLLRRLDYAVPLLRRMVAVTPPSARSAP